MMPRKRNISKALPGKGTDAIDMKNDVFLTKFWLHGTSVEEGRDDVSHEKWLLWHQILSAVKVREHK